jgi:mRNA-degrading endonuclease RelE of RelBE toxin-antitoxin system
MNYKVDTIPLFDKQAKRLSKKYPSLKKDLGNLVQKLQVNPNEGTPLGNGFYKIRLQITSKGKGKSGGGRVITYVKIIAATVYLSSIYDKGERDTITNRELDQIFKEISGK